MASLKGAALGGLLSLLVVGGLHATAPSANPGFSEEADTSRGVVQRAVADHHCTYSGLSETAIPGSALIRTEAGEVRQVSFAVGWDVYNGRRPGTLIAVCRDDVRGDELLEISSSP